MKGIKNLVFPRKFFQFLCAIYKPKIIKILIVTSDSK